MYRLRIAVLSSGKGSTVKSICDAIRYKILDAKLVTIISNKQNIDCPISKVAEEFSKYDNGCKFNRLRWDKELVTREEYEQTLANYIKQLNVDLVVLAGWNHVVGKVFISQFRNIINLHPALYGTFVGMNCIEKAYNAYQKGELKYTGSMVHEVVEEIDKGRLIQEIKVPIFPDDKLSNLEERLKNSEKGVLISVIQSYINKHNEEFIENETKEAYIGKVRRVEDIGYGCLCLSASNRLSAFDRHICNIPSKGHILNNISTWWFENTRHIIDNHFLYNENEHMIVRKTDPIKLEIVVRGYMTGSSSTSIWTMYNKGEREMYGLKFRDGYKKNEILDEIIITPTTKGVKDEPITPEKIVSDGYLTEEEYNFISNKALELFRYGQQVAKSKGLLLVDTKYEFGRWGNKIILIDELHTCDSSRYWLADSYTERFNIGSEPSKLDKDSARDWVKESCDPYVDEIPEVPENIISHIENVYKTYNKMLTGTDNLRLSCLDRKRVIINFMENYIDKLVVILAGSVSDKEHVEKLNKFFRAKDIYTMNYYSSAHKNTKDVLNILEKYEKQDRNIIYVTVAGRSNALSGVVSCNTRYPVIGCPPFKDKMDMQVNIHSTLQCPSKVPVMTILEPENVALAVSKIFSLV